MLHKIANMLLRHPSVTAVVLLLLGAGLGSSLVPGSAASYGGESLAVGYPLAIPHSVPINLTVNGVRENRLTTAPTVGTALGQVGLDRSPLDQVWPARKTRITPELAIRLTTVKVTTKIREVPIPYPTFTQPDPNLLAGFSHVVQPGVPGLAKQTVRTKYVGGVPVKQTVVHQATLQVPVPETLAMGDLTSVNRGGTILHFQRAYHLVSTGYWPDPSWSNGLTATGVPARFGIAAVDPRVIPLGSRLYVEGYGPALAADTGSAIVGNRIDLCFNQGWQAIDWGVRPLTVYLLRP